MNLSRITGIIPLIFLLSCSTLSEVKKSEVGKVKDTSVRIDNGRWIQRHEMIVPGELETIWNYYTDPQEMTTHIAPVIAVDFENGGKWEASYRLGAQIGDPDNFINEVVNIIAYEQFTTKGVRVPNNLFRPEAMKALRSTMKFEKVGRGYVKVSAITTGWEQIRDTAYRQKVFDMAGSTNPEILRCLFIRMTSGPLDWERVLNRN